MARIRFTLGSTEVEVEGSEDYLSTYAARIDSLFDRALSGSSGAAKGGANDLPGDSDLPATFGEFLNQLPREMKDIERVLAAGSFAQSQSSNNTFATADANKLLLEQAVRVTNPSQRVRDLAEQKLVFVVERGRYRVSRAGATRLTELRSAA